MKINVSSSLMNKQLPSSSPIYTEMTQKIKREKICLYADLWQCHWKTWTTMKCIRNFALCRSKYIAQYKCSTCIISILHGNISSCFLFYVFPFFPSSARLSPPRKKTVFRQNVQKQHLYRAEHQLFFCLFRKEIPERVYMKRRELGKNPLSD